MSSPSEKHASSVNPYEQTHRMKSDTGAQPTRVDTLPRICAQLCSSMWIRKILECEVNSHNMIYARTNDKRKWCVIILMYIKIRSR